MFSRKDPQIFPAFYLTAIIQHTKQHSPKLPLPPDASEKVARVALAPRYHPPPLYMLKNRIPGGEVVLNKGKMNGNWN